MPPEKSLLDSDIPAASCIVNCKLSMLKRRNPFGDSSPLQYKVHIGAKEVNFGVNQMQNMKTVYGE